MTCGTRMLESVASLITQAITLGVFPKLKEVHTGKEVEGQIYISTINYVLMLLCVAAVVGFNADSVKLGNAYGGFIRQCGRKLGGSTGGSKGFSTADTMLQL